MRYVLLVNAIGSKSLNLETFNNFFTTALFESCQLLLITSIL